MKRFRVCLYLLLVVFSGTVMLTPSLAAENSQAKASVYWIPLHQTVEQGLAAYLQRTFAEAEQAGADAIVIEIDTLGGEVGAALDIGDLLYQSSVPVTVHIRGKAISAGAYIALNAPTILMSPNSAIGAAEPRMITGETADPKTVAAWASKMRSSAESHGRDGDIAAAMVDRDIEIEGLTEKGELVSLSAQQAIQYGLADQIVKNRQEVLHEIGLDEAKIHEAGLTPAEQLARFLTSPFVVPILFIIGLIGIGIEIFTPGFGLPGVIGILAFALYFFGHYVAGFAGIETLALFIAGIILLVIELFVPGFGIFGVIGLISLVAGVVMAAYDPAFGLGALAVAFIVTIIVMAIATRYFGSRGAWDKFVLADKQENQTGYVSARDMKNLAGERGKTVTPLRPSGAMLLDGKRYDIVSEGEFIEANQLVEVIYVEGTRVVVRKADNHLP